MNTIGTMEIEAGERLWIRGLRLVGRHGAHEEERRREQTFWVDARLDLERPDRRDELGATVDYVAVIEVMRRINRATSFRLLESLAAALAEGIVRAFPQVRRARVRVRKRPRDLEGLDWVAAEAVCTRRREG